LFPQENIKSKSKILGFPHTKIGILYYHKKLNAVICILGDSIHFYNNVYIFQSNVRGDFVLKHNYRLKPIGLRIWGEYNDDIIIAQEYSPGNIFVNVIDPTGRIRRKVEISPYSGEKSQWEMERKEAMIGRTQNVVNGWGFRMHSGYVAVRKRICTRKSSHVIQIESIFKIFKLSNAGFFVREKFLIRLSYRGVGSFTVTGEAYHTLCSKPLIWKFLRKNAAYASDFDWNASGDLFILELSPSHPEWLAVKVFKRATRFKQMETHTLSGLGFGDRPSVLSGFVFFREIFSIGRIFGDKRLYIAMQPQGYKMLRMGYRIIRFCGIACASKVWSGQTHLHIDDNNLYFVNNPEDKITHFTFIDNKQRIIRWPMEQGRSTNLAAEIYSLR
jgi:hypothetical protein